MSLIVLCFLHSTSVLSFYIDVVLTLSIIPIIGFSLGTFHGRTTDEAINILKYIMEYLP